MARATIRIEKKRAEAGEAAIALRRALLKKRLLDVTPAEAAAASGLPVALATEALFHLARGFRARLRVSEAGTIRFTFPSLAPRRAPGPVRLARRRLRAWLRRHESALTTWGTAFLMPLLLFGLAGNALGVLDAVEQGLEIAPWLFVACCGFGALALALGFVIVTYNPLLFLLQVALFGLLVGRLWASLASGLFVCAYVLIYQLSARFGRWMNPTRKRGWGERDLDPAVLAAHVKQGMSGFLFGPARAPDDALADERRLTAFIVAQRGIVTTGDLMGLFGWGADEAASELPRLLLDYGGELDVTEAGALICRFEPLRLDETALVRGADTRPFHEREAAAPRLWGCPLWAVGLAFAAMGLGVAGLAANPELTFFPGPATWAAQGRDDAMRPNLQGLGLYPYMLALLPTLLRLPGWASRRWDHRAERGWRALLRVVVESPAGRLMAEVDLRALARLGGDIDVERGEGRQVWVQFPLLASAAAEAATARQAAALPEGAIVYDTHA